MLSAKTVHLDLKMKLSDNGLVNSYEIQKDGEIVFQFNNPQVSMIFLLNKLFPEQREHYIRLHSDKGWNTKDRNCLT